MSGSLTTQHPAFLPVAERPSATVQLRVADAITAFAGSMRFVYLHGIVFAVWMLVFEKSPWPTLNRILPGHRTRRGYDLAAPRAS